MQIHDNVKYGPDFSRHIRRLAGGESALLASVNPPEIRRVGTGRPILRHPSQCSPRHFILKFLDLSLLNGLGRKIHKRCDDSIKYTSCQHVETGKCAPHSKMPHSIICSCRLCIELVLFSFIVIL